MCPTSQPTGMSTFSTIRRPSPRVRACRLESHSCEAILSLRSLATQTQSTQTSSSLDREVTVHWHRRFSGACHGGSLAGRSVRCWSSAPQQRSSLQPRSARSAPGCALCPDSDGRAPVLWHKRARILSCRPPGAHARLFLPSQRSQAEVRRLRTSPQPPRGLSAAAGRASADVDISEWAETQQVNVMSAHREVRDEA